jgi:hypothetical protein
MEHVGTMVKYSGTWLNKVGPLVKGNMGTWKVILMEYLCQIRDLYGDTLIVTGEIMLENIGTSCWDKDGTYWNNGEIYQHGGTWCVRKVNQELDRTRV